MAENDFFGIGSINSPSMPSMEDIQNQQLAEQIRQFSQPLAPLPVWVHVLAGVLTKDPFAGTKMYQSMQSTRTGQLTGLLKQYEMTQKEEPAGKYIEKQPIFGTQPAIDEGTSEGVKRKTGEREVPSLFTPPSQAKSVLDIIKGRKEEQPEEYTLSQGQKRYKGKEVIAEVPKEEKEILTETIKNYKYALTQGYQGTLEDWIKGGKVEKTPPSAGNAVDLAIKRKFGTEFLTDPKKVAEADKWLGTDEGRKEVQKARDDLTPPAITYLQTGEGFVPAITKGTGIGTVGKPTGLEKPLPSEQIVSEQQLGTLRDALGRVKLTYKPEYVGFISGRLGKIGEKTIGVDERQSRFYSDVAQMRNTLVYLLSGKQINEQEYERLKEQMPVETMPVSTFQARMENFEKTIDSIISNRRKAMGGYKKPETTKEETKKVIGTGTEKGTGKRVIKYDDGSIEYAK